MNKPISKKEQKARNAEANIKNAKKRDFRKFANKMFKDPTSHLPMKMAGFGQGTTAYCYDCHMTATKVVIKEDRKIICRTCNGTNVEFRKKYPSILDKIIWKYKEFIYGRQHKK